VTKEGSVIYKTKLWFLGVIGDVFMDIKEQWKIKIVAL
jgi:hypothetical protein